MKQKKIFLIVGVCVVAMIIFTVIISILSQDTPPKLTLDGTELDLSNLTVSDLNEAGYYLQKNDNSMPGSSFKEMLTYYRGDDQTVSMGGISILNSVSKTRPYTDCQVFEITMKSHDKEGNLTGLDVTYEGEAFFGKTKEELITLFGEPYQETEDYKLEYRSEKKKYKIIFRFDDDTGECYFLEIDRRESNLAR